ncbi:putative membrane-anchored protein [Holospora obtusa F1]|uniref:Membrane-anchored protein n=1 Tax=Holospora obtusa F1 TaxID=1399147 RepID=W6TEA2_HOLOB|nr:GDYXXLXY domain-containing protein [Holospora obtusa]ETZ07009.1 putative membrane-anchored protein [Holospora obtusa F1]
MKKVIKTIFILSSFLVFSVLNYEIYQKEYTKAKGEIVFIEISSTISSSFMQGKYMKLIYAVVRNQEFQEKKIVEGMRGYVVIGTDQNKVAIFKRFYDGKKLSNDEKLLRFYLKSDKKAYIIPDSFMFQEGHEKFYTQAQYGVFKFDAKGNYILLGLADANFQMIQSS